MTTAVYRYEIPVDDRPHIVTLAGPILHVATRYTDRVELWALHDDRPGRSHTRTFIVAGTGHPLPERAGGLVHIGTAIVPRSALVWHLFELTD